MSILNTDNSILACPLCKTILVEQDKTLRCENNHCFDQAKQGYWNLHVVQQKKSKAPGDNALMVEARRQFLNLHHYQPLADAIEETLTKHLATQQNAHILDMGCGEGYYVSRWQQALVQHHFTGLDISKPAIKAATQRTKDITWIVATGAKMPIADEALDAITVVFSRLMPAAFAQVLKDDGLLVLAWPTSDHLIQLKQVMYEDIKTSTYDPIAELDALFSLHSQQTVTFDFEITAPEHLLTLLEMTPHGQRINEQSKKELVNGLPMLLSFSVNIGCFKKRQ